MCNDCSDRNLNSSYNQVPNLRGKQLRDGIKDNSTTITGGKYYPGGLKVECDENGDPIKQKLGYHILCSIHYWHNI